MSEDLNQLPGEPEEAGQPSAEPAPSSEPPQEQPPAPEDAPTRQSSPAMPQQAARPQPLSESIIPEQPMEPRRAAGMHYPPSPEYYAQMPDAGYRPVTPGRPVQDAPIFPQPNPGLPAFPPPGYGYPPSAPARPTYPPASAYYLPPVPAEPLPLGQAIRELPRQYKKILFKPGVRSFWEEQGKADWGIIWVQILFQMVLQALVSIPLFLSYNQALATSVTTANVPGAMDTAAVFTSPAFLIGELILEIILIPLIFLAGVGIQYLMAKAFKGLGTFKQQAYNQLLFQVPLGIVSSCLSLILSTFVGRSMATTLSLSASSTTSTPTMSGSSLLILLLFDLISLGIGIYSVVLNVFSIMATHRMSGGRAAASVLIPYAILFVLVFVAVIALLVVAISDTSSLAQP